MSEARQSRLFTYIVYAVQFFFGGWFLAHGSNHWLEFFPRPSGSSPIAKELIDALNHSGIFNVVKIIEVITGIMLLTNRFVPLAVVGAFPVAMSIALLNVLALDDITGKVVAVVIMAFISIIGIGHLDKFLPMLSMNTGDPSDAGIRSLMKGEGLVSQKPQMGLFTHLLCIIAGIAAPVALTFWTTSDSGPRSTAHYQEVNEEAAAEHMTPREVVEAFEKMAFDDRKPAEAMRKYAADDMIDHSPRIKGDKQSVLDLLDRLDWSKSGPERKIYNVIAEADLVAVHNHVVREPGSKGMASVDIFRVKDGKIVEHWEIQQDVPGESPNIHGMF